MFLLNVGYQWSVANTMDAVRAMLFLPMGNHFLKLTRQTLPPSRWRLLDPQLYLAGLNGEDCIKVCSRLATFSWFGVEGLPEFDSSEMKLRDWENEVKDIIPTIWKGRPPEGDDMVAACRAAIETQITLSCTHIILPSPLIVEREDEGAVQSEWLDESLSTAEELEVGQPLLATIAIDQNILTEAVFTPAGFLDGLVDQVTAREGLSGVYIVVAQGSSEHPFGMDLLVLRAYAHLTDAFHRAGVETIFTNFADVFGQVCLGFGASGTATGPTQSVRRLSLDGLADREGGKAFPQFYSHRSVSELNSERDLDAIVKLKMLGRVKDVTPYSEKLMEVLEAGGSAAMVPAWAESINNVATAQKHFIWRMIDETRKTLKLPESKRLSTIRDWLEEAEASQDYLREKLEKYITPKFRKGFELSGKLAPVQGWIEVCDQVAG